MKQNLDSGDQPEEAKEKSSENVLQEPASDLFGRRQAIPHQNPSLQATNTTLQTNSESLKSHTEQKSLVLPKVLPSLSTHQAKITPQDKGFDSYLNNYRD